MADTGSSQVNIDIKTTFDSKPVEQAQKEIKKTGESGEEAGKQGTEGFNALGTAAAAMHGSIDGVANGVVQLMGNIKGLKMSMMGLSLATATITAAVKLFSALNDNMQAWADRLAQIKTDNARGEVEKLMNSYSRLVDEMGNADKARERGNTAMEDTLAVIKEEELAVNNLARAKAIAAAKDEEERKRIELEFDERSARIEGRYATKNATARLSSIEADSASKRSQIEMLREVQEGLLSSAAGHNLQAQYETQQGVKESTGLRGAWAYVRGLAGPNLERRQKAAGELSDNAKKELEKAEEIGKQIKELEAALEENARQMELQTRAIQTARLNRNADEVTRETARADFKKEVEERRAAEEEARQKEESAAKEAARQAALRAKEEELQALYQAAQTRYGSMEAAAKANAKTQSQEYAAQASAVETMRKGSGSKGGLGRAQAQLERERREAEAAQAEVLRLSKERTRTIESLRKQIEAIRKEAKTRPN